MHLTSPFPDIPALPVQNAYQIILGRPDQADWSDYTLHIENVTGKRRKYREFVERVRDGATALGAPIDLGGLGLRGDGDEMIGIIGENSSDYNALVLSLLIITTPFALISSYSTPFELKHAVSLSKVTRLFVDAKFLPSILPVAKDAGMSLQNIYVLNGRTKGRKSFSEMLTTAREQRIPREPVRPVMKDTLAYLVFSSGTSGLPKAVMISHTNIIYAFVQATTVAQAVAQNQIPPPPLNTPEGKPVCVAYLPFHHAFGLHVFCFRAFIRPMTVVIFPKWDINAVLKAIPKYHVTLLSLIPSVVHQLVNHPQIHKADLRSLQALGSGAAYLSPALASKMIAITPPQTTLTQGYGMSETTIGAIMQLSAGALNGRVKFVAGSAGVLLPSMVARIVRDDGSDAALMEPGELYLSGPNIALGYWNNERAGKESFVDGWLRTGDIFKVNADGNYFFVDRAKDTLKVSGEQVSPTEIEAVLLGHPEKLIVDATVAGVSGGRTSDEKVPRAWVVLSDAGKKKGSAATIKALEEWQQQSLSKFKWLRGGIEVVKEIPKSPTGKTLRRVLQDRYEQRLSRKLKSKL